jgi:(p)ppGpp synthase/HD superfamily hydrolase
MEDLVQRAAEFATAAHEGQIRKYTGEPYIVHPIEVMEIVRTVCEDPAVLAAALLHDTVEDCDVTIEDIQGCFGDRVASLVDQLTDQSKPEDGNRRVRKEIDRKHLAGACAEAQTVKLADLISNSDSILEHDRSFSRLYMKEKLLLLGVLIRGDSTLLVRALRIVADYHENR